MSSAKNAILRTLWSIYYFFNWDSIHAKAEQILQGMELHEKEAQKD